MPKDDEVLRRNVMILPHFIPKAKLIYFRLRKGQSTRLRCLDLSLVDAYLIVVMREKLLFISSTADSVDRRDVTAVIQHMATGREH